MITLSRSDVACGENAEWSAGQDARSVVAVKDSAIREATRAGRDCPQRISITATSHAATSPSGIKSFAMHRFLLRA